MKEMKRIISLLLCLVMLVGYLPVNAHAEEAMTTEPSVVELSDEATGVVAEEDAAETEENEEESLTADTGDPEEAVSEEENTSEEEETPAEEETSEEVTSEEETSEEEITEEEPSAKAAAFVLKADSHDVSLLDASGSTVVIAGSDYQASTAGDTMKNIMKEQIQKDYASVYGILMGGDYSAGSTKAGDIETVNGIISDAYPNIADENRIFVQGNHDGKTMGKLTPKNSMLSTTGAHDTEHYGVYSINDDDFTRAVTDLQNYLNDKSGYTKPIFVVSHRPLHDTNRGGDPDATAIFGALQNAGEAGLNIIYLFGHNHSGQHDDYLGGGAIYLKKGDSMKARGGSRAETLNFTYMNCGYVGYSYSGADNGLTMTAFEITTDNKVIIKRYDANGLHNLKSAGKSVNGYTENTEVYGSAVIDLTDGTSEIKTLAATPTGGNSGSTGGSTGGSGNVYVLDTDGIDAGEEYLIVSTGSDGTGSALTNNSGTSNGTTVTISGGRIELDNANAVWVFSGSESGNAQNGTSGYYIYPSSTNGKDPVIRAETCALIFNHEGNGEYTIQRDNQYSGYYVSSASDWTYSRSETSVYLFKRSGTGSGGGSTVTPDAPTVDTEAKGWVTISDGKGQAVYVLDTDGTVDTGVEYLIVAESYAKALGGAESSKNVVADITIDGNYAYADSEDYGWIFTKSGSDYTICLNGTTYLGRSSSGLSAGDKNDTWSVEHESSGAYTITQESSGSFWDGSTYYVRWSNSNGYFQASSRNTDPVRLYKYLRTEAAGDAEYAKLSENLTVTVSRGADSTAAEAAIKEVVDVLVAHAADYSDAAAIPDSDENIIWTLASNYDGNTPGEYAVEIYYKEKLLGTAKVIVPEVSITGYDCQTNGSVKVGATGNVRTGANITVKLEDGTSYTVPVTLDMLSGDFTTETADTYTGLTVTYNRVVVCENFTLTVREPSSYPEYPDEGAVKVNKTGTGVQFQSTGVAQVEISASGIPMNQGVDVVLVLDTSYSMSEKGGMSKSRIEVLRESVDRFIATMQAERADGSQPNVDIAIVNFDGYTGELNTSSSYNGGYGVNNYLGRPTKPTQGEYGGWLTDPTGDGWVDVNTLETNWGTENIILGEGTNYDHGLEMAYDLLLYKQQQDGSSRKQFVLFMSDGAPFQYNGVYGYTGSHSEKAWLKWINASYTYSVDADGNVTTDIPTSVHNPEFYAGNNNGNGQKHRIAEAIKGSTDKTDYMFVSYPEIEDCDPVKRTERGLGATIYSVGFALESDNNGVPKATQEDILKGISSDGDKYFKSTTTAEDLDEAFALFAGDVLMAATNARFVDQMGAAYNLQMGQILDLNKKPIDEENKIEILSYDIWTRADYLAGKCNIDQIGNRKGTSKPLETITFNADGTAVYSDKDSVGPDGQTIAAGSNILIDGVIYAQNFWYNTTSTGVAINGVNIPTGVDSNDLTTGTSNVLPAETFYWKVGTIKTTELAMRYYVYLEGSMEGTREGGSYPTNEYAILYYDNYLDQHCHKDTVSPVMAWKEANVSYAFYLVNEKGEIIVNQTSGETGSFANKIAITNPAVYKTILLNNQETLDIASLNVVPDGYKLYDATYVDGAATEGATYTVTIHSDTAGEWDITTVKGGQTTYVMQYDPDNSTAYSNKLKESSNTLDYTHTVVWFAVVWTVGAYPDSVVIDYGLPVDIAVLSNDMFGENGKLVGVGPVSSAVLDGHTENLNTGFGNEYKAEANAEDTLKYGDAKLESGKVRYTLRTMQMDSYDKFAYAVNYTGANNLGYYYDTVTVIPATTIYYEDSFLTFRDMVWEPKDGGEVWEGEWNIVNKTNGSVWSPVVEENANYTDAVQSEDRPGKYSMSDANNIYGYDSVNQKLSTYSLGSAMKATVNYDQGGQASFDFCGTGFDVIGLTSNMTGTIWVKVYDSAASADADPIKNYVVDTYYGYTQDHCHVVFTYRGDKWIMTDVLHASSECTQECASIIESSGSVEAKEGAEYQAYETTWIVDNEASNTIWQVPVMQIENLTYGNYKGVIEVVYEPGFDHVGASAESGTYDFYLDAIRIYDPANDGAADGNEDQTIENAYKADGEGWPSYIELRNKLIDADDIQTTQDETLDMAVVEGMVFIDGSPEVDKNHISDYVSYGPNNEVYLAKNQSIAFMLKKPQVNNKSIVANIHLGIKSANGAEVSYTIKNIAYADVSNEIKAGDSYGEKRFTVDTTTDMYYDIGSWSNDIIVIKNTSSTNAILSLTNIKATYTQNPNGVSLTAEEEVPLVKAAAEESGNEVDIYMTPNAAALTLRSMNTPAEEEIPEPSVPESSEPEKPTVPEETKPVKPDNSELKAAVAVAKKLKAKNYTYASFKKLEIAIKAAEKVLKDKQATQTRIDEALENLNAAMEALEVKPDNSELKAAVNAARKLKAKDYTRESFKVLESARKAAEKVLKNKNATQAQIDEALAELNEAVEALEAAAPKGRPAKKKR